MVSKYFEIKTNSDEFKQNINTLFEELKDKKVLIYGAGEGFVALDKKYDFKSRFNVIGISDLKFEKNTVNSFRGLRTITPQNILNEQFDTILVTNESSKKIISFLKKMIPDSEIKAIFTEELDDESVNLNYLYLNNFDKTLPKLIKRCKGKKVIIYGAGILLKLADKYFDLSGLDIVAVTDQRYKTYEKDEKFLRWNVCSPEEIKTLKPDTVIIATKYYIDLLHATRESIFDGLDVRPLIHKSFITLLQELWART